MGKLKEDLRPIFEKGGVDNFFPLVAVDVGNNRVKCGLYTWEEFSGHLPCTREISLSALPEELPRFEEWLGEGRPPGGWWIATVNRPASTELIDWLRTNRPGELVVLLTTSDLPFKVDVPRPDMVGIDRLVDALAAYLLHDQDTPVVVVDIGSAITVDLVSGEGVFQGGAILPGIGMSARALYEFTDMLPLVDMSDLTCPPSPVGKNTVDAMKSGLFWGPLGAIMVLAQRMSGTSADELSIVLTGGGGKIFAQLFTQAFPGRQDSQDMLGKKCPGSIFWTSEEFGKRITIHYVPHLTLWGIALAAAWVIYTGQVTPAASSGVDS